MLGCRFSLFCVVAILFICFFVESSPTKKCKETERQALLKLKGGFTYGREVLTSWEGEDCCKWKGVSCDNLTGHVTGLDLEVQTQPFSMFHPLQGKLDASICELHHLTSLNLLFNYLEGKIPKCIGSLGHLIELQLGNNQFAGVIPPTLGNLSNLQTLLLGYNPDLNANDLEWISHLSNLRYLDMTFLNLSRAVDWLSSISKIPSLSTVLLSGCELPPVNYESTLHLNSSTSLKDVSLSINNLDSSTLSLVLNVSKVLTHLYLNSNELEGSIPESLKSLCQLKVLSLEDNKLSGQLSDNMKQLSCSQNGLEMLYLCNNQFSSGPLPDFSGYSSLRELSLQNTNIVGTLPHSLGHLPYLEYLDLSYNKLSGLLSLLDVTELASLEELDLSKNQLNGTLPFAIGQLTNLSTLALHSNKLNGVISEAHLSNLSSLTQLVVSRNPLSFNLSSNWIPPFQLKILSASSCILGPKFPTWLKKLKGIGTLEISNSGISDSIPDWFWDLYQSFYYVNVSRNKLSGPLPQNFTRTTPFLFDTFDLSFNNLSGPLPIFPQVRGLFLSNNRFSGSLSSSCASPPQRLQYLDLSSNLLEGPLLDCWEKFPYLTFLNLGKNKLSGRIPKSFGTLQQMKSMHLNNNNFSGEIPSLTLCTSLTILDLGDNKLQGTLPAWVGHDLHQLIVLVLKANMFRGNIPTSLCNLSFLQVLDLSQNNITGEIPQCLSHIIALSNTQFPRKPISSVAGGVSSYVGIGWFNDEATLTWKGENREYGKSLGLLTIIDLSCNHLTGEIPQSITKLVALAGLNLSRNNLSGSIPNNIGHMEWLESLDLSRNHLCGRMPASFSNLSFLSDMNLSFNNLSGKIPTGTQLQSFNASSYVGNTRLCGPPLTNHCQGDVMPPTGSPNKHVTDEDDDKLITFGFYISLVLGFGVGFWGVCGTLVIKASWRHAYFRFFHNMNDWIYMKLVVFTSRVKKRFQAQV